MKPIIFVTGKVVATLFIATQAVLAQEKSEVPNTAELKKLIEEGLFRTYKQHYAFRQDIDGKVGVIDFAQDLNLLATDNVQGGRVAADALADAIKAKYGKPEGDVALITSLPGVGSSDQRAKGFEEQISAKYPDLKLVVSKVSDDHETTALNTVTGLLVANPKLRGVFVPNPVIAQGAAQAIAENKVIDQIKYVAFNSEDKLFKLTKQTTPSNSYAMKRQQKGDTASGVVINRETGTLTLDITPCSDVKNVIIFLTPYKEKQISDVSCKEKALQRSQVIQQ